MRLRLNISAKTDKGRKRQNNEDCFYIEPDLGFMILADGMGGHASGEVASKLATNLCAQQLKRSLKTGHVPIFRHISPQPGLDPRTIILGDCFKFSNQVVYEAAQKTPENHNMGTTLVAALWLDKKLAVAHVGDSRLYLVRNEKIFQCTVDHSFVQEQVNKGFIKPEEAEKSDFKNMLTRSIGVQGDVDVDVSEIELEENDYVLLCSDGLTKMLSDKHILSVFHSKKDPEKITEELIRQANEAGGLDNITVIVAHVDGGSMNWGSLTDRMKGLFKKKGEKN